ncbi:MAG: nucleoside phosphorylase [Acidimicrobiales bacterium]
MAFPSFAAKHAEQSFVTPADFLEVVRQGGRLDDLRSLESVVLVYQPKLWRTVAEWPDARVPEGAPFGGLQVLGRTGDRVGVAGGFGIGAPAASVLLEGLVAAGVRRCVSVGTAGALQPDSAIGRVVLCTGAVRDEGVSHHYIPADVPARPSPLLTEALGAAFSGRGLAFERGPTWTIDAPYRETVAELRHYQAAGVRSVEMEAAALFAVGQVREIEVAAAFCYSDLLAGPKWEPHFGSPVVADALDHLLAAAVATLEG